MPPESDDRRRLEAGALSLGLSLDPATVDRLLAYRDLLARWNQVYNLTAVRDPAQMVTHHLLDSLAAVGPLHHHSQGQALRVLDVGSGGGLPGVVLAITCPELSVVCVDTVAKKAMFLRQVAAELKLPNLQSRHARVESLQEPGFDVVTSRAFASLADFVALTRSRLAPGGVWMALKGPGAEAERAALPPDCTVTSIEPLQVPGLGAQRCLVWMKPSTA